MHYNFHTHTYHCHHASGTPEEYVLRAIENGITEMGFSDHFPLKFEDGTENAARVPVAKAGIYRDEVLYLKEKYKNEIQIRLGFEMEYYHDLFPEMKQQAIAYGAEYLLLGEHYTRLENTPMTKQHTCVFTEDKEAFIYYTDMLIEGMKTGAFTYVAHPDVFNFHGDEALYIREAKRIAAASAETGIALEINFLGIRDHRHYPSQAFFRAVAEMRPPVTFGFDAHTPESAYDSASLAIAWQMVRDLGLNYIGKPKIRPIV